MKNFREFISEEILPFAQTEKGFVGIDNGPVRDNINLLLANVTAMPYSTPYHALEAIRRVLISFHIALPATNFLDGDVGHEVFPINQFGKKLGALPTGDVVTQMSSAYSVYFEYEMTDRGSFEIFCEVVDDEELQAILADVEDEDDYIDHDAEDSYDAYKAGNMNEMHEDYDSNYADLANHAKKFFNDPSKVLASNARKIYKNHNDRAVTGMKKKVEEASVTPASKKAEKGTKWKVKSRNPDSEGSEVELRQGKRKKMVGYFDRNSNDFHLSKTKKGKLDMKDRGKSYDTAKDILKDVKEEKLDELKGYQGKSGQKALYKIHSRAYKRLDKAIDAKDPKTTGRNSRVMDMAYNRMKDMDEQAKWRQGKEANPTSVNPRNDVLKPVPGKKMRSGIGTWLSDGKRKTPVQGHANTPDQKGSMAGPRRGAVLPEETINELSKGTLGSYITKASHDVATKSAAVGRYAERSRNDQSKSNYMSAKQNDDVANKMFKKSWKRRQGIAKATDKLTREDYDHSAKQDADDAKAISKSFRKKDKPEAKAWKQATKKLYNKAVTGLPQKKVKGLGGLDEENINEVSAELATRAKEGALKKSAQLGRESEKTWTRQHWKHLHKPGYQAKLDKSNELSRKSNVKLGQAMKFSKYADEKKTMKEATEEEMRQKRLAKWVPKEKKPKKLGKNAELVAGWKDDIAKVRAGMKARQEKKLQKEEAVNEVLDTPAKKKEYQDKANDSFKSAFGKKDPKSAHTVSKRLDGLRMTLRKKNVAEETKQLEYRPTNIPDKDQGKFTKNLKFVKKDDCAKEKLDEVSHDLAKRAEHKAASKYYDAYDAETDARKKFIKSKDQKDKAASDSARETREKAASRVMRFQKYADKKKLNEMDSYPPGASSPEHAGRINKARDAEEKYYKEKKKADSKKKAAEGAKKRRDEPYLPFGKNALKHFKDKKLTKE